MIALAFTLELLEPVLATSLQGDPNSGTSYPFIPGSLIRGAIIDRYLAEPNAVEADVFATDSTTRHLFLDGQTRYLPAYLLIDEKHRTLPTALSWYKEKNAQGRYPIYDKAHSDFEEKDGFAGLEQPKPLKPQFCRLDDDQLTLYSPERQVNIHTQRERRAGRATESEGAVFRYEALAPGQSFGGVILLTGGSQADLIESLLSDTLFLGGSRSAGYGRTRVVQIKRHTDWWETGGAPDNIDAEDPFTITLLSDLIIRDEHGQYADTLTAAALAQALHLDATALETQATFKQNVLVGGFNRKWGLPLSQTVAIRAGSVFSFKAKTDIPAETIAQLLNQGLGERRAEGFGRLTIDWPDEPKLTVVQAEEGTSSGLLKMPTLNASSQDLARQMSQRLLRRDADRSLGQAINEFNLLNSPKRSQLGGLRVIIRSALARQDLTSVSTYLAEMKPTAKKQFEQGRISRAGYKEALLTWLNDRLKQPDKIWDQIRFNPANAKQIGSRPDVPDQGLAVEYTLRLIDGVLAKTAKAERSN